MSTNDLAASALIIWHHTQLDFAMVALGFQKSRGGGRPDSSSRSVKASAGKTGKPAGSQSVLETILDDGTVKHLMLLTESLDLTELICEPTTRLKSN